MPKVAAIQFAPKFKDHLGNLRSTASLASQAAEAGASLIVLPELATTGYSFMSRADAEPFAEILPEFRPGMTLPTTGVSPCPSMIVMHALCKRYGAHIAWGLIEKDHGTGDIFNTQVLMTPDGSYESYRKVNRWGNDFLWSRPGRGNPPVLKCALGGSSEITKVGLLICRDVRDKKDSHWDSFYEKGDADLVVFSANWGDGGFPAVSWMDFVEANNVTLIVSNRHLKEVNNDFGEGGSCIIEPPDKVHCDGLLWNQDCIIYADL